MSEETQGLSRRNFLKGMGVGAVGAAAIPALEPRARARTAAPKVAGPGPVSITLDVNGQPRTIEVEPRVTLLDALRNHLDLTGSKKVCDRATCGACSVLLDGKAVYACTVLAIAAQGRRIETVESLGGGGLAPIQKAIVAHDGQQCGFCTPGFVVACESYLRRGGGAARAEVEQGLGGNLCRCGTYVGLREAVMECAQNGGRR